MEFSLALHPCPSAQTYKDAREQGKQLGRKPRDIYIINTTSLHSVVFLYNYIEKIRENVVENYIVCTCVALTRPAQASHTHELSEN